MTDGVNDDLGFGGFAENEIGVGRRRQATNARVVRAGADVGIKQRKLDDGLNAGLNASGTLR